MDNNLNSQPILLVDDETHTLNGIKLMLELEGFNNVYAISDSREVMPFLKKNQVSAVLLDLVMPHISGEKLLNEIIDDSPLTPVIINTSSMDVHTAVKCLTHGAFDYVIKPVEKQRLISAITKALSFYELNLKNNALKKALAKSEELSKIKTQLLEVISHEFRTPLNAIIGFTSIALEKEDLSDEIKSCLKPVLKGGNQILRMIDNVIDASMLTGNMLSIKEEPLEWKPLIEQAFSDTFLRYPEQKEQITVIDKTENNVPAKIKSDHKHLQKIINEIINNSVKFSKEGTISYFAKLDEEQKFITWTIEDNGCGITDSKKENVFNLFYQADMSTTRGYDGLGIGLNITKNLIALMGGSIHINKKESAKTGTIVCFKLPYKAV